MVFNQKKSQNLRSSALDWRPKDAGTGCGSDSTERPGYNASIVRQPAGAQPRSG